MSEPLDRSTRWAYDEHGEVREFSYQRFGSPTVAAAEAALGELDGGTAVLFPSGAGATTALVLSLLEPGNTVALAEGCYYGTGLTFDTLAPWGVRVVEFDQTGPPPDDVQLVWLEAPANPYLTMPDLEAAAAHAAPVVVDATVATPVQLRPLEHGADFVFHSATKYLAGHDDAAGHIDRAAEETGLTAFLTRAGTAAVAVCGKIELEIAQLDAADAAGPASSSIAASAPACSDNRRSPRRARRRPRPPGRRSRRYHGPASRRSTRACTPGRRSARPAHGSCGA